jgi:hypothetical protein
MKVTRDSGGRAAVDFPSADRMADRLMEQGRAEAEHYVRMVTDAVLLQSFRAAELCRQYGLEVPCTTNSQYSYAEMKASA